MRRYEIDIDSLELLKYGIKLIALTDQPAIIEKGVALTLDKPLMFSDTKKMQIIAPLMIPMNVYRSSDGEGDYEITLTARSIEAVTKQMMKNLTLSGKQSIFTDEHSDKFVDAFIYEINYVDSEAKQVMFNTQYGLDVPQGSTIVNVQCTEMETYNYLVDKGKIGLSIDGLFNLKQIKMSKQVKSVTLSKPLKFREGFFKYKGTVKPIAFEADALEEGKEVVIYDETGSEVTDWTGEVTVMEEGEEVTYQVEEGEVKSKSNDEEEKIEAEKIEEEKIEAEAQVIDLEAIQVAIKEAVDPILEKLTELQALINQKTVAESDNENTVQMSRDEKINNGLKILIKRK